MEKMSQSWNALRSTLNGNFCFYDIKDIVGLAGFNLASISDLVQKSGGGATKGQLMTGIDDGLSDFDCASYKRFIGVVAEEVLDRKPNLRDSLDNKLSRLDWSLSGNSVVPIEIFDLSILPDLPTESQQDLTKAARWGSKWFHLVSMWRIRHSNVCDL